MSDHERASFELTDDQRKTLKLWYEDLYPSAVRWAAGLTRNQSLAEDMVQEAFCNIAANMDQYETHKNPGGLLYRIIQNTWIDHRKKHSRFRYIQDPDKLNVLLIQSFTINHSEYAKKVNI